MPKTCAEAIQASLDKLSRLPNDTGWQERHRNGWYHSAGGFEQALVAAIRAAAQYADSRKAERTFKACQEQAAKLRAWLGELTDTLLYDTERE